MTLPVITINGGARTFYKVRALITEISKERNWKNLWLVKTNSIKLKIFPDDIPDDRFENSFSEEIGFLQNIIIHDVAIIIENRVGDIVELEIGYADSFQQYWHGVRTFTAALLDGNQKTQLV